MAPLMRRICVTLALLAIACGGKEQNPVIPTDPTPPTTPTVTVTVTADTSQVYAGASATMLHITASQSNGANPADGTEVTVNTSLGSFSTDDAGMPVRLTRATLTGGRADVQFFPGSEIGTANILAQVGTSIGRLNLAIVTAPPTPVANFTFATNGLNVLFTDASTGSPTSRRWQFGDGTESTDTNPSHTYANPGTYTVTLTVTNAAGSASKMQFVTVTRGTPPTAAFEFEVNGSSVHFVDRSTGGPTSWLWQFGDGSMSNEQNPIHSYNAPGSYTATLTVSNAAGSNSTSKVVTIAGTQAPVAAFEFAINGKTVNFVDRSTNTPTAWLWQFGDGSTSTAQNPIHTYAASGNYTVTLTASNNGGSSSATNVVVIPTTNAPAPVAAFDFTVNDKQVNFVDRSTNAPTSWLWDFGDGLTSTTQNPIHVYGIAGSYTVTLTATNASGSNSISKVVTIAGGTAPTADFEFIISGNQVNFVDRSTGNPTSWFWFFGDGNTSSQRNPIHVYPGPGTYTVTLNASNANGTGSHSKVVTIPTPP